MARQVVNVTAVEAQAAEVAEVEAAAEVTKAAAAAAATAAVAAVEMPVAEAAAGAAAMWWLARHSSRETRRLPLGSTSRQGLRISRVLRTPPYRATGAMARRVLEVTAVEAKAVDAVEVESAAAMPWSLHRNSLGARHLQQGSTALTMRRSPRVLRTRPC